MIPLLAKVIVHANSRNEAIQKMKLALSQCVIEGIDTNIDFLLFMISSKLFMKGFYDNNSFSKFNNNYIEQANVNDA